MKVLIFLITIFPAVVMAGDHEDRQDNRARVAYDAIETVTDEVIGLKNRVKVLETVPPRQALPARSSASRTLTTVTGAVDEDMREAFFVREGQDAEVAKAAARTRDRSAGREALLSVARKGAEREAATMQVLEKLETAQARTNIVLEKGLGKKYSKIARDYGFK